MPTYVSWTWRTGPITLIATLSAGIQLLPEYLHFLSSMLVYGSFLNREIIPEDVSDTPDEVDQVQAGDSSAEAAHDAEEKAETAAAS